MKEGSIENMREAQKLSKEQTEQFNKEIEMEFEYLNEQLEQQRAYAEQESLKSRELYKELINSKTKYQILEKENESLVGNVNELNMAK